MTGHPSIFFLHEKMVKSKTNVLTDEDSSLMEWHEYMHEISTRGIEAEGSTFILQEERKTTTVISAADPKFTRGPRNGIFEKLGK
jgi:hypothetical protein